MEVLRASHYIGRVTMHIQVEAIHFNFVVKGPEWNPEVFFEAFEDHFVNISPGNKTIDKRFGRPSSCTSQHIFQRSPILGSIKLHVLLGGIQKFIISSIYKSAGCNQAVPADPMMKIESNSSQNIARALGSSDRQLDASTEQEPQGEYRARTTRRLSRALVQCTSDELGICQTRLMQRQICAWCEYACSLQAPAGACTPLAFWHVQTGGHA
jgi:hypothetical protein